VWGVDRPFAKNCSCRVAVERLCYFFPPTPPSRLNKMLTLVFFCVLLGVSTCGKNSFLRLIADMARPCLCICITWFVFWRRQVLFYVLVRATCISISRKSTSILSVLMRLATNWLQRICSRLVCFPQRSYPLRAGHLETQLVATSLQASGTGLVYNVPPYPAYTNVQFSSTRDMSWDGKRLSTGQVFLTVMLINKAQCPGLAALETLTQKHVSEPLENSI